MSKNHALTHSELLDAIAALQEAFTACGVNVDGKVAIAEACGVSRNTVAGWTVCPAKYCPNVEEISGVDRRRLRPDVYRGM